jgi:hypothetical protein
MLRSDNTKLSESIKAVADEMSIIIEIANKNLSDSLTKQFREEDESHGIFWQTKVRDFEFNRGHEPAS